MNVRKLAIISKICIAINDNSQGSIAKHLHLSYDGLLYYKSFNLLVKEFLKSVNIFFAKLQAKRLIDLDLCPQRFRTSQISKITAPQSLSAFVKVAAADIGDPVPEQAGLVGRKSRSRQVEDRRLFPGVCDVHHRM